MDLESARQTAKGLGLTAPESYWEMPLCDLSALIGEGGCGPGVGWKEKLLPDTVWGLSITPSCAIHDYQYATGKTPEDKMAADVNFLGNMDLQVDKQTMFWPLKIVRHMRTVKYYEAVRLGGHAAFWKDKHYG